METLKKILKAAIPQSLPVPSLKGESQYKEIGV